MNEGHETLPGKWRRFLKRPPEDRALILRAMAVLPLTGIGLRVFGFRRCKEWMEKFSSSTKSPRESEPSAQLDVAARAVRAICSAELHGPAAPNCLERSMVLWWLLRREGIHGELHIGARKNGAHLEAHAWVELGGRVLNDHTEVDKHYARFDAPIAVGEESGTPRER
jgi:Transglutaminase-like superfamily